LAAETAELQRETAAIARAVPVKSKEAVKVSSVVYDPVQLEVVPRATAKTPPKYPSELMKAGKTGDVLVEFVVDEKGTVIEARAVRSSDRGFESAAVEAIKKWTFEAGRRGGLPVNTRLQQPIAFTISKEKGTMPSSNWF